MEETSNPSIETLIARIRERAYNLYRTRQMLCAEAVLSAMNQGLNGGLTHAQTTAMAAPFCAALGQSGCLCGALSGAVMASGLLLGQDRVHRRRKSMRASARRLHDAFMFTNGATCCRTLTRKVKHDPKAHFRHCADLTAQAAEMAARLVLAERPELATRSDSRFLAKRDSTFGGAWCRLVNYLIR